MRNQTIGTQSEKNVVVVKPQDLSLYCSDPNHKARNGRPHVFLPVQSNSKIEYPCCGTYYRLDGKIPHHHY